MNKLEQAARQALGALVRAEAMYGQPNADIQTALREALAEQAEQEPVLMPVRRGTRITCMESDESCVVWTTSDTHAWVQFPDGQIGKYTYEQIGSYFSLDKNYATDEAYERGLKEGIEAGKKIAEQAEQEPVFNADDLYSIAGRLALELECLLMDTKDLSIVSRWWDSAHEALEQWRCFHSVPVQPMKQEPVAWRCRYCNTDMPTEHASDCPIEICRSPNEYAAPVSCATSCPDAKAIRAEALEEAAKFAYKMRFRSCWTAEAIADGIRGLK